MELIEELKVLGIDVDDALERFMGNASLYERMLKKLPDMIKSASVQPDFDCENYEDIIEKAHKLKGVTGNLSITPLYRAYTEIVNLLRDNQPEKAKTVLTNIMPVQTEIIRCIEKYTE